MRKTLLAIFAVCLAAIALRVPYIYEYRDVANLDEATVGVMALDILKGDIPVFMYGQNYFGPLESLFISAGLLFFPPCALTLRLSIFAIYLLAMFVLWRGARLALEKDGALMALAWFSIPPVLMVIWSALPSSGHVAGLFTGALIFYLTARIIISDRPSAALFFVSGLIIGFSLWNHPGNLLHVLAGLAVVFIKHPGVILSWKVPAAIGGVAIGGAPFWLETIRRKMETFEFGQTEAARRSSAELAAGMMKTLKLMPSFFGYELLPGVLAWPLFIGFIGVLVISAWFMLAALSRRSPGALASLFGLLLGVATLVAFTLIDAHKVGWIQYRYFLPIILGLAYVFGHAYQTIRKKSAMAAAVMAVFLIGGNGAINIYALTSGAYNAYGMDTRLQDRFFQYKELIPVLNEMDAKAAFVRFYDDASIIFESGGKIAATAYTDSRMYEYALKTQAAERPPYVVQKTESDYFEKRLASIQAGYKKRQTSLYNIYYDLKAPRGHFAPLDMTGARAIATPHPGDARYAIDGNWDTFWNSNKSQTGDESLTIDLGTPANISRIDILPSRIGDTPAHVAIDLSMDGDNWTTVADALNIGGMMWTGPNLAFQVWEMFSQYIFEPVQARYIKIRQTGHASKHWHVREIFAYERRPATTPATDAAPPWGEVLGFMNEQGIRSVISDFYFSANVITRSSGEIWANTRINRVNPDKRAKQEFGMGQFDAVAVHDRDWAQVKGYFDSQGTEPDVKRFGPYRLIYGLGDSPRQARTLDAGSCKVVDRTTTVVCDFGEPTNISVFRFAPDLLPFGKRITGWGASSPDNENWTEPIKARPVFGKVRWTGSHIVGMAPTGAYAIPETNTRFLRFALD